MDLHRRQTGAGAAMLVLLLIAVWLLADIGRERERDAYCVPLETTGRWQPVDAMTERFARYGNNNSRLDDWAGGEGARAVRLPDGRVLWLFTDTLLGRVESEGHRLPANPERVRNSALVMGPGGLGPTLLGGTEGHPIALFPSETADDGGAAVRRPTGAVVEPRRPGSDEKVLRVLLQRRVELASRAASGEPGGSPGEPRGTEVATLSLPDLKLEGITSIDRPPPTTAPEEGVQYGTAAVPQDGWTYLFGAAPSGEGPSRAYLARAPAGRLAEPDTWRYWDGSDWSDDPSAVSALHFAGQAPQVTGTYSVVRRDDAWLLLTMDVGGPDGEPSPTVVSYWACSPHGPWHGPRKAAAPPLPPDSEAAGALPRNPQGHNEFTGSTGTHLLISYDIGAPRAPEPTRRAATLHRPHFLRLTLALVPDPSVGPVTDG